MNLSIDLAENRLYVSEQTGRFFSGLSMGITAGFRRTIGGPRKVDILSKKDFTWVLHAQRHTHHPELMLFHDQRMSSIQSAELCLSTMCFDL